MEGILVEEINKGSQANLSFLKHLFESGKLCMNQAIDLRGYVKRSLSFSILNSVECFAHCMFISMQYKSSLLPCRSRSQCSFKGGFRNGTVYIYVSLF